MRKFLFSAGIIWIAFWIVGFATQRTGIDLSQIVTITFVPAIAAFLIGLLFDD